MANSTVESRCLGQSVQETLTLGEVIRARFFEANVLGSEFQFFL